MFLLLLLGESLTRRGQHVLSKTFKEYGREKVWKWKGKNTLFHRWGFTFFWPLVLTVGTFYRKWTWTSEAWAGWGFLQKRSWRPAWVCSPPNLRTRKIRTEFNVEFVFSLKVFSLLPVNRCTLRGLRDSEVSFLTRFGAENSWVSSSWMLLQQMADREREYYIQDCLKAPIWGQKISVDL